MSGPEPWLVEELAQAEPHPAAFSFLTETARQLGDIGTDFDQFRNAGLTGLHFVYLHGSPIYHTEADDRDAVSVGALQHHGMHALSIARHFGDLNWADPDQPSPWCSSPWGRSSSATRRDGWLEWRSWRRPWSPGILATKRAPGQRRLRCDPPCRPKRKCGRAGHDRGHDRLACYRPRAMHAGRHRKLRVLRVAAWGLRCSS